MKHFAYLCWVAIILVVLSLPSALKAWFNLSSSFFPVLFIASLFLGYLLYRYLYRHTLICFSQTELKQSLSTMKLELDNKNLQQQLEILDNLVARDSQTGLWNKGYCLDRLQEELKRAQRYHGHFSVFMLDLDNFKNINDNLGHLVGDKYLDTLAELMEANTRLSDFVCRYGGDEFFIILPDTVGEKTALTAEKLCKLASEIQLSPSYPLSISIGVCDHCENYDSIEEIIVAADVALYRAKNAGRNQVRFALPKENLSHET